MIIDSHAHAGVRSEVDWDFSSLSEHRAYDQRLLWTRLNIGRMKGANRPYRRTLRIVSRPLMMSTGMLLLRQAEVKFGQTSSSTKATTSGLMD